MKIRPPAPSSPVSLTAGLRGEGASLSMPGPKPSGGQCYWSKVVTAAITIVMYKLFADIIKTKELSLLV